MSQRKIINPYRICHGRWGVSVGDEYGEKWLGALIGHSLTEGMKVLDYGCGGGGGRLSNYLSYHLADFKYYGVELPTGDGPYALMFAKLHYSDDRTTFGLIGSDVEKAAIDSADVVVLGSVFTHVLFEDALAITRKFQPIFNRQGKVIASVFIGPEHRVTFKGLLYGHQNCYGAVEYTKNQLARFDYTEVAQYVAQDIHLHHILRIDGFNELYL